MDRTELFSALTLFYVVVLVLRTDSAPANHAFNTVIAIPAVVLLYAIPAYLLIQLVGRLLVAWDGN